MPLLFSDLCLLLDRVAAIKPSKTGADTSTAAHTPLSLFKHWLSALSSATPAHGLVIFRLLFPDHDIRRRYGLKETLLARELPKALGFRSDALSAWKDAENDAWTLDQTKRKSGCFGIHLEAVLAPRRDVSLDNSASLTLERVDYLLDELASHCEFTCADIRLTFHDRQRRTRSAILHELFSPLSAREASYLVQIILRDLSPLLYPLPTSSAEAALTRYNSNAYQELGFIDALRQWNWVLPTVYRYRADLDKAFLILERENIRDKNAYTGAERHELLQKIALPELGTRIEIPKAIKGRSCRQVAELCHEHAGDKVYLETKYDGERMQIHVDVTASASKVRIYSKSKRDSTMDRIKTHPLILAALGLPFDLSPASPPSAHLLRRIQEAGGKIHRRDPEQNARIHSIVLEAEMVAYNEETEMIDEFAYIPECAAEKEARAPGHSQQRRGPDLLESSQTTTATSQSAAYHVPARHLAIVFFEVLLLNGESLVFQPYEKRRQILESIIRPIEGYTMLAQRTCIDFRSLGFQTGYERLVRAFAKCIVDRQEGLMVKSAQSSYNDSRKGRHWIKLKRDYIPGLGDTASCAIVGASWTKERGRELRVPNTCFTTFYIGLLQNAWELENGTAIRPRYLVLFSVSHLASRDMLLEANNRIVQRGGVDKRSWMSRLGKSWAFDLSISNSCSEMSFVLTSPLVLELYGAGFTRSRGSKYYELRFPRVSAIHHSRRAEEAVTLEEMQSMGREASSWIDSEAEEEINDLWTRCSSASGGEGGSGKVEKGSAGWRNKQEQEWVEKLMKADRPKTKKRKKSISTPQVLTNARRARRQSVHLKQTTTTGTLILDKVEELSLSSASGLCIDSTPLRLVSDITFVKRGTTLPIPQLQPALPVSASPFLHRPISSPVASGVDLSTSRSLIVSSTRSSSFVVFITPAEPSPPKYLWTVFPKQAIRTHCLPYEGRINSLNLLLQQAGYRSADEPSCSALAESIWTEAIVFTTKGHAINLAAELRRCWVKGQRAIPVYICDVDVLAMLKGPLERVQQLGLQYRVAL